MSRAALITCERCLPPGLHAGSWWRYTVRTRSGLNSASGMRQGSERDVRAYLKTMQQKMELREHPYGPSWRAHCLTPDVALT